MQSAGEYKTVVYAADPLKDPIAFQLCFKIRSTMILIQKELTRTVGVKAVC